MDEYTKRAEEIIAENIYCTVATASSNGTPWISPVFFAYDESFNLFWVSYKKSRHSELIRSNPEVSIVIFNSQAEEGEGEGVYFESKAEELNNETEIIHAMEILGKRVKKDEFRVKKIEEVIGNGVWRIYKATPKKVSKLTEGEYINGQYIDKRVAIKLP